MGADRQRIEAIRKSKRRNRFAVALGGGVTIVATLGFLLLPTLLPLEQLKLAIFEATNRWIFGNPLANLWLLGPTVGGLVAGYLAVDRNCRHTWMASMKHGVIAAIAGVGLVYVAYAGFIVIQYAAAILTDPGTEFTAAHLLDVFFVPMAIVLPLLPVSLFEGLLAGLLGNGLHALAPADGAVGE